ncbi:glycosyltransferase family 4 protein [Priestia megaterium NCT-2]|uniref:glycosyltransferase n=1 Tax=Priestia megaterium TaxID=1404 RepID=UPI0003453345|nr:glycosyltransferase [Priestia megaterium]AYE52411.1 glycosyltransferase family 4 protein [Priestia megaterium NCT-2]
MKICILSIVNIKHMALISLYTSYFEENGIEYDIIYIDKYNEEEHTTAKNVYRYPITIDRDWNKLRKLSIYWGFKKYAQKILDEKKYDYVIVWRTETAFMFADYLSRKMRKKYCVNVRDYCLEKNPFIFQRVKKAIKNASFTTISSDGFKTFLPKQEYITIHSFNEKVLEKCKKREIQLNNKQPIRIGFIGYIRFVEHNKQLMQALKNDKRFVLQFFGAGSEILEDYAQENDIKNVEFHGKFNIEETAELLDRVDVINNLFGHGNPAVDTLISIRLYYAVYLKLPILVHSNTYMQEIAEKCGIGFTIANDDFTNMGERLSNWLNSLDYENVDRKCNEFLEEIEQQNRKFRNRLEIQFK